METSRYIGNVASKEFHKSDCFCVPRIKESNRIAFSSEKEAIHDGFDTCGHCLGIKEEVLKGFEQTTAVGSGTYYFVHFYGKFNDLSTDEFSGISVNYGQEIELFATIHKVFFEASEWNYLPVQNCSVDLICADINFQTKNTDANGRVAWNYTIPQEYLPGTTHIRLSIKTLETDKLVFGKSDNLWFDTPQRISNITIDPNPFYQNTKIYFKLETDMKIKADIYKNTYFGKEFSHVKNIRDFSDGVMQANEAAYLDWDGLSDHAPRENLPVMKGSYVVRIVSEFGDDQHRTGLEKTGGILGGTDPQADKPTEYVSDLKFSPNPFSRKTKVKLDFELIKDATVSIHIQHINWNFTGECTKVLLKNAPLKAGKHSYTWDGKNNTNSVWATFGEYKVRILANDTPYVKDGLSFKADWNL